MYYVTYAWESSITNPYINMSDEEFMVSIKQTNYSAEMSLWREMSLGEMIVKIVVMALVFLTAVTGNFLVPIVLLRERRLRTVTHIFLVNLTVADMLVALSTTWVHLIDDFTSRWILGAFICKFSTLTQILAFTASVLTMTAMSLERFHGVVTPFIFINHKKRKVLVAVGMIWVISLAVAMPSTILTEVKVREWANHNEVFCHTKWVTSSFTGNAVHRKVYAVIVAFVLYGLPMLVMTVVYAAIILKIKLRQPDMFELNPKEQKRAHKKRRKVTAMLIVLLTVFTLCWLPFQCVMLYQEFHYSGSGQEVTATLRAVQIYCKYMAYANSAFNPLIIVCFSQKIRAVGKGNTRTALLAYPKACMEHVPHFILSDTNSDHEGAHISV
ncbi:hypothetical protein EB796_006203 [Bugula neritina]|uniref:G-protein coupled receptors family 1 profile domain-containing protein n=1 Tax=Bugula neritina TaxID=10212 RepID=A0A7J7KBA2_BUGNE|nr:hypothetical protein EB796_006203 [Bugula neritina]